LWCTKSNSHLSRNIEALISKRLPLHKGAFFAHLCFVNFPDKHCLCVHKSKIRHTSFEIYRISENCP
jgi:hypothetical protein